MRLSEGKKPFFYYNKTVLLPLCDNKCDWIKHKSDINCLTKIWQYVVSLIYCIDKSKNTKFTLYYMDKQVWYLHQIINF
jgi:hypothetical protein